MWGRQVQCRLRRTAGLVLSCGWVGARALLATVVRPLTSEDGVLISWDPTGRYTNPTGESTSLTDSDASAQLVLTCGGRPRRLIFSRIQSTSCLAT